MHIAKIFKKLNKKYENHQFSNLKINSKNCKIGDIFFAIKGTKNNGNSFINEAIKNGAKTIVSSKKFEGFKNDVLFLSYKNPREILSYSASKIYKNKPKNLTAITGTNGKSSIADFYVQILNLNNVNGASIGTLGVKDKKKKLKTLNTTPENLTLNKLLNNLKKSKNNNVIIEASSHGLQQNRLTNISFSTGIFTNLSRDHLDYHKSLKQYLNAKLILFKNLIKENGYAIFNNISPQSKKLKKICKKRKLKILSFGKGGTLEIINHRFVNHNQYVKFNYKNKEYSFKSSLIGKIQIENILMAALAATRIVPMKRIVNILHKIKPINGRLEKIGKLKNLSTIILDYAHTPDALKICIKNIRQQFKHSNISILFGCGGERDKSKREIMGNITNDLCDKIYLTDDNPRKENPSKIRKQIKKKIKKTKLIEISSRKNAIKQAVEDLKSGDVLIVAGKGHENYQEYKIKKLFSDKKCIKECILKKNKSLSIYWKTNIISEKLNTDLNLNKFNIHSASLNSKNIKKNQFFVGVKGKKFDGNKYASEALKNRASVAVIDKFYPPSNKNKIFVKNSLNTFSNIAAKIRIVSKINSIGITGSAGKTSLKELIGQSLSKFYKTSYSRNSFNNKFGVPLSLFNIKKGSKFGVFEIGMDKKGEIHNLSKFVQPSVGIITNISYAHIKNFKNLKEIAEAKSEIINNITNDGIIILNKDDKFFNMFKSKSLKKGLKIISISKKKISDINITKITKIKQNYLLTINVYGKKLSFLINKNFIDYSENILFCVAVLSIYFNIERLKKNLFLNFKPIDGRGNNIKLKYKNKTINLIDETYNSNPLSLNFSLQKFNRLNLNNSKKHLLLGDMRELGKFSKKLHLNAASLINKLHIDKVNVYGKFIKHTYNKIKTQKRGRIVRSDKDIMEMIENLNNNDYLLIKGSNSTGLNQIVSNIRKKYAL